jgi:ribosomal protein L11 methyltransferase
MAFGTGMHPSTQLSLQLIETYCQPDRPMMDIGCGSGILSIAGLKLGASRAIAVDTDLIAVRATGENAARNGVLERLETGQGSVEEIEEGGFSVKQAPLVAANILAPIIISLLERGLACLVEANGVLILAGILDEQADRVTAAAKEQGLTLIDQRQMGDWVALAFKVG